TRLPHYGVNLPSPVGPLLQRPHEDPGKNLRTVPRGQWQVGERDCRLGPDVATRAAITTQGARGLTDPGRVETLRKGHVQVRAAGGCEEGNRRSRQVLKLGQRRLT